MKKERIGALAAVVIVALCSISLGASPAIAMEAPAAYQSKVVNSQDSSAAMLEAAEGPERVRRGIEPVFGARFAAEMAKGVAGNAVYDASKGFLGQIGNSLLHAFVCGPPKIHAPKRGLEYYKEGSVQTSAPNTYVDLSKAFD